jgi:NAD(P)-dependent dehydrogenase (short-subunit alcohol dehydrogenase family)
MKDVVVVIGPGQIGQAIARRVGVGKHLVLADLHIDDARTAADVLENAGYDVSVATTDVSSREAVHALVEGRAATPDEIATVGALLMGPDGAFITGSDILMDGGVTSAYWYGDLAEVRQGPEPG